MSAYRAALLFAFVGVCLAIPNVDWELYKSRHGKHYETLSEDSMRHQIFEANRVRVERFNEQQSHELGYTMGLNHLSDWTSEELSKLNGLRLPEPADYPTSSAEDMQFINELLADAADVPNSLDWRQTPGRVAGVKNQGQCGSCWAFATVGLLEGQERQMKGTNSTLIALSEQDLLDCSTQNMACDGGLPSYALDDIRLMGGIDSEADYPYKAALGYCRFNKSASVITDKGSVILPAADEHTLKATVAKYGPVAVAIQATDTFQHYNSGVLQDDRCSAGEYDMNHAVLIVGYGTDATAGDYWIVKNSWGAAWGEAGYLRMVRGKNQCGIANMATIARL